MLRKNADRFDIECRFFFGKGFVKIRQELKGFIVG